MSVSYEFKFKKDNLACMTVKNFHPDDVKKSNFRAFVMTLGY